ncbi:MAG: hypothetical protein ACXAB7_18835 [Candidatus Kariarchaeaceae archaeon]|jgi:hypothetical protein
MSELTGIAKTIFDEVMDEIEEELQEALEMLILKDKLDDIISSVKSNTAEKVTEAITKHYTEGMSSVKKLILGETVARIVTAEAKEKLQELSATILKQSFDVVDELRNEIIGEVFEETEAD